MLESDIRENALNAIVLGVGLNIFKAPEFGVALNDVVLLSGDSVHMIEFELFIDGMFVYNQRSDGLILCTPTGSTAYALSCGGPIMHPAIDAMALVPLNPHTLTSRPLVVGGNSEIIAQDINEDGYKDILFCNYYVLFKLLRDRIVLGRAYSYPLNSYELKAN